MKSLKLLFNLLILLSISLASFGQGWVALDTAFQSGIGVKSIQTNDNGYLQLLEGSNVSVKAKLRKYDDRGNLQWEYRDSNNVASSKPASITSTQNNNFLKLNDELGFQISLSRIDALGNLKWKSVYNLNQLLGFDNAREVIEVNENMIAITGNFNPEQVLIYDSTGTLIDSSFFLPGGWLDKIIELGNGEYFSTGSLTGNYTSNIVLVKFNSNLDTIWTKDYDLGTRTDYKQILAFNDSLIFISNRYANNIWVFNSTDGDSLYSFTNNNIRPVNDFHVYKNGLISVGNGSIKYVDFLGNELWSKEYATDSGYDSIRFEGVSIHENSFLISGFGMNTTPLTPSEPLLIKTDSLGNVFSNEIIASIFLDLNNNCLKDSGEYLVPNIHLTFSDSLNTRNYFSDQNGRTSISTGDGYSELLVEQDSSSNYQLSCLNNPISFNLGIDTSVNIDIPLSPNNVCPGPYVTISNNAPFRACRQSSYDIFYCNAGTQDMSGVYVEIEFNDFLNIDSSSIPYQATADSNIYRFNIGQLDIFECGTFSVEVSLPCQNLRGLSVCATANIYPDTFCVPQYLPWDESNIEVDADCQPDSVQFRITNDGIGDMDDPRGIIIVEDNVMYQNLNYQLNSGQQLIRKYPANGSTWRLEAEQDTFHPFSNKVVKVVEGCGAGNSPSTGFVNIMPLNYGSPFTDYHCDEVIGSFDPNDKKAFPYGVGNQHFISNSDPLNYKIRFQNTGKDTAFYISIRDTLSEHLKVSSVISGASSHDYEFEVFGQGILEWRFKNILLPDSNVNEPKSHGFVEFTVDLKPNLPNGTVIENDAAIYFDFNAPVITNSTFHTIGELGKDYLVWLSAEDEVYNNLELNVYPNPSSDQVFIDLKGLSSGEALQIEIFDLSGKQVLNKQYTGNTISVPANSLNKKGMYLIRVSNTDKVIANGKVVKL